MNFEFSCPGRLNVSFVPGLALRGRKETMSEVNEYRVRPVNRFVLTHFHQNADNRSGGVRTIGEFPNVESANEVADVLRRQSRDQSPAPTGAVSYPLPPVEPPGTEYAIVGNSLGDESTIVHYAYSEEEATQRQALCRERFGGEFKIFARSKV